MKTNEKKVRKTITLSKEVANQLEKLAKEENKSQSELVEEILKEKLKEIKKKEKKKALKILEKNAEYFAGVFGNKTIQELKGDMADEL